MEKRQYNKGGVVKLNEFDETTMFNNEGCIPLTEENNKIINKILKTSRLRMGNPHIELIQGEYGGEVLRINSSKDFIVKSYRLSKWDWINLLEVLGYKIDIKEISDKDMKEGNY